MISENRDIQRRIINGLKHNNRELTQERNSLVDKNMLLSQELAYFKTLCVELEDQVDALEKENLNLKSRNLALSKRNKWLTSEEAGRQFARELLGGA